MRVLGIVQEMCVKIHNIPLRTIQYREFNKARNMMANNEYCITVAKNFYVFKNKSLGLFLVTDTIYLTKRHGISFQLVLPPSYLHKSVNLEELESSITINVIDSNIIRNDNQFVYLKRCAHNMFFNIYILNTVPFIEKFVYVEI